MSLLRKYSNEISWWVEQQKYKNGRIVKILLGDIINELFSIDNDSEMLDILNSAEKEVIIIDNFLDKSILDIIRNIGVNVILITSNKSKLKQIDIDKYCEEYSNLEVRYNDTFHDRYIIIDKSIVYHLEASINHAGSKTFSINILED